MHNFRIEFQRSTEKAGVFHRGVEKLWRNVFDGGKLVTPKNSKETETSREMQRRREILDREGWLIDLNYAEGTEGRLQ